jgi:hypothetical protein
MFPSFLVYAGAMAALVGGVSVLKPLRFLRIRSRRQAAIVLGLGVLLAVAGVAWPAGETRTATPQTRLDEFVPVYQFSEFHSIRVAAPRESVYQALKAVTASEVSLFRTLAWIRRFGRSDEESILNPAAGVPLVEEALRSGFLLLADEPGREIVLGTLVVAPRGFHPKHDPTPQDFKVLHEPGFALAAMNFRVEDAGPGECQVTTETRVYATDASARSRFARYWRVIYPGSALIRRMWLRAVKRRAETAVP